MKTVRPYLLLLFACLPTLVSAQLGNCNFAPNDIHVDVCITVVDPPGPEGLTFVIDNDDNFRREAGSGYVIVESIFADGVGSDFQTDDPGWVVPTGQMLENEFIWFRARGSLEFWDVSQQRWLNAPPNGEQLRYLGNTPPDVQINGSPEELALYAAGTIWNQNGHEDGPTEAPIEPISGGELHAHLDFCIEDGAGDCSVNNFGSPTIGAYLIELEIFSKEQLGGQDKYKASPPLKVLFNHGLGQTAYNEALAALTVADVIVDDSPALPAAGVLIMTGP